MIQQNRVEEINLLDLFDRFKESKKTFYYTGLLFLFIGFLVTQYIWPSYTVKSDIQVQIPEVMGTQTSELIYGSNKKSSVEIAIDEAVAIRAFPNMLKAMDSLNFHLAYYIDNFFADEEIYHSTPFEIQIDDDSSSYIPHDEKFKIEFWDGDTYYISGNYENENTGEEYEIDTMISPDEWINVKTFRIKISKPNEFIQHPDAYKGFLFAFRDINEFIFDIDEELSITPKDSKTSSVLEINLNSPLPSRDIDFVNLMQELYLKQSFDTKTLLARNSLEYIEKELNEVSDSLEFSEQELQDFQVKNKIANASDEAQRISETIDKLESEKAVLSVKSRYYSYLKIYFQDENNSEKLVSPAAFGITDMVLNDLTKQLSDLLSQKSSLFKEGKTKNPEYKSITDKIDGLKATLKNNVENFNVSNDILLADVKKRLAEANETVAKLPVSDRMLVKIQRNVSLSQDLYMLLQEKKSQAETILQASTPSSRIIDPAHLMSPDPNFPPLLVYPIMLVLSILLVMSFILTKDFMGGKIISKKLAQNYLNMPFIGSIPLIKKLSINDIINQPTQEIAEAARIILFNSANLNKEDNKVILLSSAYDGEGKSFLSSVLSVVSTLTQKRTLLINADMRNPAIQDVFKLSSSPGLSDYLEEKFGLEAIIQNSGINKLDIITSGTPSNNPGALCESNGWETLIKHARNNYDRIIIDTASSALFVDAFYLIKNVDVALVVVRKNQSNINGLKIIEEANRSGKLHHAAFILNGVLPVKKKYPALTLKQAKPEKIQYDKTLS
jgi:capsular exopolysaccharide synthesis family protein